MKNDLLCKDTKKILIGGNDKTFQCQFGVFPLLLLIACCQFPVRRRSDWSLLYFFAQDSMFGTLFDVTFSLNFS